MVNTFATDGFLIFDKMKRWGLRKLKKPQPAHCEFVTPGRVRRELKELDVSGIELHGRLFGFMRLPYKAGNAVGRTAAKTLEYTDDAFCRMDWTVPMAGHLIVVVTK